MPSTRTPSRRATKFWTRMIQSWGGRLTDDYGRTCPEDWGAIIDRTDPERLDRALIALRQNSPNHPPTLGQLEAAIPKKMFGDAPSVPDRLCCHALDLYGARICEHQLSRPWNYFGQKVDDGTKYGGIRTNGVQIPPCESCGKPSHRVMASELPPE